MNEKLLDNYDKMVVKDTVAVIHCAFGDTPHTVAMVSVDKGLLDTEKCDKAFMLTNSIDNAWMVGGTMMMLHLCLTEMVVGQRVWVTKY